ncbi:MAG: hypothetical protein IT262_11095 [Saprospiraceae bacterium]|nr:hypothetical protein [Saprospiraceae bacterium]
MIAYNFQLENLYQSLLQGTSVLVIGPELFRYEGKQLLLGQAILEHLISIGADRYFHFYDTKDDFFYFKEPETTSRNAVYRGIHRYLTGLNYDPIHEKIARLPFPLIVNLSPDLLLANAFNRLEIAHEFRFFHKSLNRDINNIQYQGDRTGEIKITPERPLVYNLFGHIDYEESMVLSYRDLFDYLYNIFGRDNLPGDLRALIEPRGTHSTSQNGKDDWRPDLEKDFVFLGLGFNKWYTQLMLRLLHAHTNSETRMQRYVLGNGMDRLLEDMSEENADNRGFFYIGRYFALQGIQYDPVEAIEYLYQKCEAAGKLRETGTLSPEFVEKGQVIMPLDMEMREMLSRNKVREVVTRLMAYFREHNLKDGMMAAVIASSSFEEFEKQSMRGLFFAEERYVVRNRIINSINEAISIVRNHQFSNTAV